MSAKLTQTEIAGIARLIKYRGRKAVEEEAAKARREARVKSLKRRESAIVLLRKDSRLSAWEKGFIATLDTQGPRVSPAQSAVLDRLIGRYLE